MTNDTTLDQLPLIDQLLDTDLMTVSRDGVPSMRMPVREFRAAMTGTDYSDLTERAVPGTFWRGSQVYRRTFVFTVTATDVSNGYTPFGLTLPATGEVVFAMGTALTAIGAIPQRSITTASVERYTSGPNSYALFNRVSFFDAHLLGENTAVTLAVLYTKG